MKFHSHKNTKKGVFDKYELYRESVQSPDADVDFFEDTYKEIRKKKPAVLCEDFCGTFDISCHWVRKDKKYKAIGVDLDPEPIGYGQNNYLPRLKDEEQKRITIHKKNVLDPSLPKTDIIAACNFSYFIFKKRQELLDYVKNCHRRLNKDGLLIMDCFGGSQCQEPNEEETKYDGFKYYWDQDMYDPVNNHGLFYIHFKLKGQKKKEKVFTYDWRMWSIPELRDILEEAGFKKTHVYWEGTDDDGEGDGNFTRTEKGEDCEAWVAYVVAEK